VRTFLLPQNEPRVYRWVRRFAIATLVIHSSLFCWSIYRRIWQVQRIEVLAPATVLAPSATVGYDVITSGEVRNLIRLELVQGAQHEILLEQRGDVNRISAYDPRVFRYTPTVTIGAEVLSRFHAGPAALRLTVFGGQKLLHTPPARVRELQVRLAPTE
jgi:hypothetical protein